MSVNMSIKERYNDKIETLSNVNITTVKQFRFSNILLFREYQSRLYDWKLKLGFDGNDFFNKRKSYHNLFLDIGSKWINELISEEEVVNGLNSIGLHFIHSGIRDYMGYFMFLYINWEVFKIKSELKNYASLKHPYETLFIILLRGGL